MMGTVIKEVIKRDLRMLVRDWRRLFWEFVFPLLLSAPLYAVLASESLTQHSAGSLRSEGYEYSAETYPELRALFDYRNYSDCTRDNRYIAIASKDQSFLTAINKALLLGMELPLRAIVM